VTDAPFRDPEVTKVLDRVKAALCSIEDDTAKLRIITGAAAEITKLGGDGSDPLGDLSDVAVNHHRLDADAVQVAIAEGVNRGLDARDGWPEPDMRLIEDDCVPAPQLDNDALPAGWSDWISSEAQARGCPRDYVAAGLIGAASGLICNARRVAATADWTEPAHVWSALIGAPSAGKTPALRPVIDASRQLERDEEPAWRQATAQYERDAEAASAREKAWRERVRDAASNGRAPPNRPTDSEPPVRAPRPRLIAMDTSVEELQRMLAEAPRGLLYTRDELSGWLGSFGRYSGKDADRPFFLECWNGAPYVSDRVKYHGDPIRIEHASVAIIGGMVPDRLREVLAGADDGLTARLLYVWPEPVPIAPLTDRGDAEAAQRRDMLIGTARRLRALPMGADENGALAPIALRLDEDARKPFDKVRCDWMKRARNASGLAASWAGKNPGRALRLALVFELLTWSASGGTEPEPVRVSADAIARAGRYLDYAAKMLVRVAAGLAIGEAEADAAELARHLLATRPDRLNERELYQMAGFSWARNPKRRKAAFGVLESLGWLRHTNAAGKGRRRGDWEVSPRLKEARP
jgi:hypothetical protein